MKIQVKTYSKPFGNSSHNQHFGLSRSRSITCPCKAYLIDELANHEDYRQDPTYAVVSKNPHQINRLRRYIRVWERALGVKKFTNILTTQYDYVILVKPSADWMYGPPGLHLHTFLIRTGYDWDGVSDPLQHIYTTKTGIDATYATSAKDKIEKCIAAKTLPFRSYTWNRYHGGGDRTGRSHGDGFVELQGDPTE